VTHSAIAELTVAVESPASHFAVGAAGTRGRAARGHLDELTTRPDAPLYPGVIRATRILRVAGVSHRTSVHLAPGVGEGRRVVVSAAET
jgi:hypothetical protein